MEKKIIKVSCNTENAPRKSKGSVAISRFFTLLCNGAKRITIPIMIGVGFTDELCPPIGGYAIYNALQGEKCIYNKIHHGHSDAPDGYDEATWNFLTGKQ